MSWLTLVTELSDSRDQEEELGGERSKGVDDRVEQPVVRDEAGNLWSNVPSTSFAPNITCRATQNRLGHVHPILSNLLSTTMYVALEYHFFLVVLPF